MLAGAAAHLAWLKRAKALSTCAILAVLLLVTLSQFSVSRRLPPACAESFGADGSRAALRAPPTSGRPPAGAPSADVTQIVEAFLSQPPRAKPHKISMCTIIRDEAPYLPEWLLYHLLLGFDHFTLYDNGSKDNTREVLQPFIFRGYVTLIEWPTQPGEDMWEPQWRQLEDCLHDSTTFEEESVWRGAFDVDEFVGIVGLKLSPKPFLNQAPFALHTYLSLLEEAECGGIIMDRIEYAADFVSPPPGGLVITDIVQRRVSTAWPAVVGKPLVFSDGFAHLDGGLNFTTKPGYNPCFSDRTVWDQEVSHARVYEPIRLHHYVVRSYEECLLKISPEYNSQTKGTWRTKNGMAFCNASMPWTPEYKELSWVEDRVLADALFPEVITALLPHFKP